MIRKSTKTYLFTGSTVCVCVSVRTHEEMRTMGRTGSGVSFICVPVVLKAKRSVALLWSRSFNTSVNNQLHDGQRVKEPWRENKY